MSREGIFVKQDRSYLFVPGERPERFDKAIASGAHAVILDLEDAVLPPSKSAARLAVQGWLERAETPIWLRINPPGTPWFDDDCALLQSPMVRGLMLPKAHSPEVLHALAAQMRADQQLIPLVESVAGWFAALELARVPKVLRLAFGSVDFMSDSGIRGEGEEMNAVRTHLVLVSRLAGIQAPIDGVSLAIDDAAQLHADVQRSKRFGFGAKLCIHPKQVRTVCDGFLPTEPEVEWAQRVIQAVANEPLGAVTVDGKLVDKPIVLQAHEILDSINPK